MNSALPGEGDSPHWPPKTYLWLKSSLKHPLEVSVLPPGTKAMSALHFFKTPQSSMEGFGQPHRRAWMRQSCLWDIR